MSKRKIDHNGYTRVEGNPISKVGVFDYLGSSLGSDYIQDKIYKVYRPEEALNNKDTIDSFKNIPWIDDHEMLGKSDMGLTPAENKGIHGTTGEDVYFDYPYLKANLNIYSEYLGDIISEGKKELSPGYRCKYTKKSGSFKGEGYEVVQEKILGNHLATVQEGRTGPDVAVLDQSFTLDSKDLIMFGKDKDQDKDKSATAMDEGMQGQIMDMMKDAFPKMMEDAMKPMMEGMVKDAMYGAKKGEDADMEEGKKGEDAEEEEEKGGGMDTAISKAIEKMSSAMDEKLKPVLDKIDSMESKAMDAASNKAKIDLAKSLEPVLGTFDHSGKTLAEVQDYALDEFGLDSANKTQEQKAVMIDVYLHTSKAPNSAKATFGQDSSVGKVNFRNKHKEGAK